jgi:predicted aconitase with swiveling domain
MPSSGVDPGRRTRDIRQGPAAPEEQTTTTTTTPPRDVLHSTVGLSFWGGIDPLTGIVIDSTHPLHGSCVSGKILCVPSGRGSCTGSQVMLELILGNIAPYAILLRDADAILCAGAIIAEEFFGDDDEQRRRRRGGSGEENGGVPIIAALGVEDYAKLEGRTMLEVVRIENDDDDGVVRIRGVGLEIFSRDLLRLKSTLHDDDDDEDDDDDDDDDDEDDDDDSSYSTSTAEEIALRTIGRVASISGATRLVPVTRGHVDAVTYVGDGGLRFARRLVELGGRVRVR